MVNDEWSGGQALENAFRVADEELRKVERERDAAVARADQLRDERDDAVQSCLVVGRERDEWKARAAQAARVIGSVMSRWDMDGRPDVDGGIDTLLARALADAGLLHGPLPTPADGCQCTGHSQDYGGYVEYLMEYEPSCPEHSEHVWNPRTGMWEHAVDRSEDDGRVDQ